MIPMQAFKNRHNLLAGLGIKVTGRLIRKQHARLIHRAARKGSPPAAARRLRS